VQTPDYGNYALTEYKVDHEGAMKQLYLLLPFVLAIGLNSQVKQSEAIQQGRLPSTGDHSISVKVIDAETGQPVKGIWVPLDDKSQLKQSLTAKTDSHGVAGFHLSGPLPERIGLSFSPLEFGSCSELEFVTDQILRTGVVAGNSCKSSKPKPYVTPEAGQLVIFGKRVTLWQRVLRELP
jgi:hypothetical protein